MIEPGQATLAVTHLTPVLKGDMPYIGVERQREVMRLSDTIAGLAKDVVYDRLPKKVTMPRPFTYRQALKMFTQPVPEAVIAQIMSQFPPGTEDVALSFKATLAATYKRLASELPVSEYQTYLGPRNIQPTSDKVWQWFSRYWVIDDPLVVFPLMQGGCILSSQVAAVRDYFPAIYEEAKSAILAALTSRSIAEAKFLNLPPRSDRGVAIFLGKKLVPYGSNIKVAKPEESAPAPAQGGKNPEALATQGQKAAAF